MGATIADIYRGELALILRGLLVGVVILGLALADQTRRTTKAQERADKQGAMLRRAFKRYRMARRALRAKRAQVSTLTERLAFALERNAKLEEFGSAFEKELKRVDGERRFFKDALRAKQRKLEDVEETAANSGRPVISHLNVDVEL